MSLVTNTIYVISKRLKCVLPWFRGFYMILLVYVCGGCWSTQSPRKDQSTEFRRNSCHGPWLTWLLCKAMLAPTWELKALPQSHESWPTFWHGFCPRLLWVWRDPTSSIICVQPGFFPHRFCYPWDWYHITQTASKHSNGTSPVYRWCDCELNLHWELPSHIWSEQTQFQGVKGCEGEMGRVEVGKGDGWRVSEHDDHLSCRG